jgi:hypothetical protein
MLDVSLIHLVKNIGGNGPENVDEGEIFPERMLNGFYAGIFACLIIYGGSFSDGV